MASITETPTDDTSGFDFTYETMDDLLLLPDARIGKLTANAPIHGYSHVDGRTQVVDFDTFETTLVAGETYRLIFTPDIQANFYSSEVAWLQNAANTETKLVMNQLGTAVRYVNGALTSGIFGVTSSGTHYLSVSFGVPVGAQLTGSVEDFGYTLTLKRIGPSLQSGTEGADLILGDAGENLISGLGGRDRLKGLAGNDTLLGGTGGDLLLGGRGKDSLVGDDGNDRLAGGRGNDTLTGGAGADSFRFAATGARSADHVTDFTPDEDRIGLDHAVFKALGGAGALSARAFALGTATTSAHHVIYDPDSGKLRYDDDGAGGHAARLIAVLDGAPVLSAQDFFIF